MILAGCLAFTALEAADVTKGSYPECQVRGSVPVTFLCPVFNRNSRSGNRPKLNMLRPTFGQTGDVQVSICIEQRFWTFTCIRVPRFIQPRVSYHHRGFSGIMREVMAHRSYRFTSHPLIFMLPFLCKQNRFEGKLTFLSIWHAVVPTGQDRGLGYLAFVKHNFFLFKLQQ